MQSGQRRGGDGGHMAAKAARRPSFVENKSELLNACAAWGRRAPTRSTAGPDDDGAATATT
eukprot:3862045-Pyramimonas_sp.AAC.1